mmetsp:Transcript_5066/g.17277  ORF Transcript_5066/g.17277 Transcript_5066/m.17277 type:complete len:712 (+) Transcript_5066:544-2679(+)
MSKGTFVAFVSRSCVAGLGAPPRDTASAASSRARSWSQGSSVAFSSASSSSPPAPRSRRLSPRAKPSRRPRRDAVFAMTPAATCARDTSAACALRSRSLSSSSASGGAPSRDPVRSTDSNVVFCARQHATARAPAVRIELFVKERLRIVPSRASAAMSACNEQSSAKVPPSTFNVSSRGVWRPAIASAMTKSAWLETTPLRSSIRKGDRAVTNVAWGLGVSADAFARPQPSSSRGAFEDCTSSAPSTTNAENVRLPSTRTSPTLRPAMYLRGRGWSAMAAAKSDASRSTFASGSGSWPTAPTDKAPNPPSGACAASSTRFSDASVRQFHARSSDASVRFPPRSASTAASASAPASPTSQPSSRNFRNRPFVRSATASATAPPEPTPGFSPRSNVLKPGAWSRAAGSSEAFETSSCVARELAKAVAPCAVTRFPRRNSSSSVDTPQHLARARAPVSPTSQRLRSSARSATKGPPSTPKTRSASRSQSAAATAATPVLPMFGQPARDMDTPDASLRSILRAGGSMEPPRNFCKHRSRALAPLPDRSHAMAAASPATRSEPGATAKARSQSPWTSESRATAGTSTGRTADAPAAVSTDAPSVRPFFRDAGSSMTAASSPQLIQSATRRRPLIVTVGSPEADQRWKCGQFDDAPLRSSPTDRTSVPGWMQPTRLRKGSPRPTGVAALASSPATDGPRRPVSSSTKALTRRSPSRR